MTLTRSVVVLLLVLTTQTVLAQRLTRPFGIVKSPQLMMQEAESAKQFFKGVMEATAPSKLDLLKYQSPVKNQGQRGSCVAFASTALVESLYKVKTGQTVDLSEQFAYWQSKAVDHIVPNSDGSWPLPFMKSVAKHGIPSEQAWPYESKPWFEDPAHPDCVKANQQDPDHLPTQCVTNGDAPASAVNAPKIVVIDPHKVPSAAEAIMGFLQKGMVVELAVDVYEKAWSYKEKTSPNYLAGVVTMPPPGDKLIGGHAILAVGYDREQQVFIFKNSWGTNTWASKGFAPGYGVIPFDYVRKYGEATVARMP